LDKQVGFLVALALTIGFVAYCFDASGRKSPTSDEPPHLAAGFSYVDAGVIRANPQHPPLLKELCGLSLRLSGIRWPDNAETRLLTTGPLIVGQPEWAIGNAIITGGGPDRVMFWARLPFILVAALLPLLLYAWGCQTVGPTAALGAVFLCVLDPTFLAHAYLVTTDVGAAVFTVLYLVALWNYLRHHSLKGVVLCGLCLGALLCTKFSTPLMVGVTVVLLLVAQRWPIDAAHAADEGGSVVSCLGAFAAMCGLAYVTIQAVYLFPRDPFVYLEGLRTVNADHNPNYLAFLAGAQTAARYPSYFLVTYLLKEPLPAIVLAAIGLLALLGNARVRPLTKWFLILPPAVVFVGATIWAANVGIRYLFSALPFAYLLGGVGIATLLARRTVWAYATTLLLCAWMVLAAVGIHPDHLSYFNEAACVLRQPGLLGMDGGSRCGVFWLDDHNVDWGQGFKQLKEWLDAHARGAHVWLGFFGSYPPDAYGIEYERIGMPELLQGPMPGLYAVSAHLVARGPEWLRGVPPTAIVGHALYVYDLRPRIPAAPSP